MMFDRDTKSLWSQVLGRSVHGELEGRSLVEIPSERMTWGEWKAKYPQTTALSKPAGIEGSPYDRYFSDGSLYGISGQPLRDHRLPGKSSVLGLPGSPPIAVPLKDDLRGLVRIRRDGQSILVVRKDENAVAWKEPRTKLKLRKGELRSKKKKGPRYDPWTGRNLDGSGPDLEPVDSRLTFWFTWASFHDGTLLRGLPPAPQSQPGPQSRPYR